MKRDMDLVRQIMLQIEASEAPLASADIQAPGYGASSVAEHLRLLVEADLIEGVSASSFAQADQWLELRLTWAGHDFLDAARDDELWRQATAKVTTQVGSVAFEVLKAVLSDLASRALGLR